MEVATIYIADDGTQFFDKEECQNHENNVKTIYEMVNNHKDNPSERLVVLISAIQDILGIKVVSYDGYVELFRNHKPCVYACSLWKLLSDYCNTYPTINSLYGELMGDYIDLYGGN